MTIHTLALVAVVLAALIGGGLATSFALSQGGNQKSNDSELAGGDLSYTPPSPDELQKQFQRWQATWEPSKWHRLFERLIGEWETETSVYMQGPDGPAMKSSGTTKYEWEVPGKWVRYHGTGNMMGQPVEQFGTLGYDNFKQKFVAVFHDSLSTNLLTSEGTLNADGTTLMLWGSMDEPMTGQTDKSVRYDYVFESNDLFSIQVHDLHIGGPKTKVIEIRFTRKK